MNVFGQVKRYINRFDSCETFTRKALIGRNFGNEVTIDIYRAWLTAAGYLEIVKRGVYRRLRYIPPSLTLLQLRREAYEN